MTLSYNVMRILSYIPINIISININIHIHTHTFNSTTNIQF